MTTKRTPLPGEKFRFVFLVSMPADEVLDGSDIEIREESAEAAIERTSKWGVVQAGATLKLIGTREGSQSSARFLPLVPVAELPAHIVQNERFAGTVHDPEMGERDAEIARLERLHNAAVSTAFWGRRAS